MLLVNYAQLLTMLSALFVLVSGKTENEVEREKSSFYGYLGLNTNARIPIVGLGTWQLEGPVLEETLNDALKIGYRHIDTATLYNNEEAIGKVLEHWLASGRIRREELFVTTKLPLNGNKPELVSKFVDESLKKLKLEYIDLYLIHFPTFLSSPPEQNADGTTKLISTDIIAIWKELETEVRNGKVKSIGLSNFNQSQILRIKNASTIKPSVLQTELHVYLQEKTLVDFCSDIGVVVTAYFTLGSKGAFDSILKGKTYSNLLQDETVVNIAKEHGKTPAQVLLRFFVQQNIVVIPKTSNKQHLRENFQILDFLLTRENMQALKRLDRGEKGRIFKFWQLHRGLEKHAEYPHPY